MKKRMLSLALALVMVLGLMPMAHAEDAYLWPSDSTSTSQEYTSSHKGQDIAAPKGSDIYATKSGTVVAVYTGCANNNAASSSGKSCGSATGCDPSLNYYKMNGKTVCNYGYGNGLAIKHSDGSGYSTYSHMQSVSVTVGQTVSQGDVVGQMGSAGNATGTHCHFELVADGKMTESGKYFQPNKTKWINNNKSAVTYIYKSDGTTPSLGIEFLPAAQSTWANKEKVEETNAVVVAQIKKNNGVKVTEMGLDLYDANRNLIKSYSQKVTTPDASTSWPCYWDINEEIGVTLTPGTTYKYCFTGVFNGTKYESEMWSFETKGPKTETPTPTPEPPVTQPTEPPVTSAPESMEVRYKVEHYLERTDAPGNYKDEPETAEIYSGKAGQQVTLHPTSFDGYRRPAEQYVTLPNENSTYRIYYRLASYTVYLSGEPGIASMAGGGLYRYGEQVTLSAQVEDGYQWAGWSDGSMQQIDYCFTMPGEDLTLTALATPVDRFVSQLPDKFPETREWSVLQFDDLSSRDWYYESVKSAYCYDLMNGRGVSEFAPNGTLTVAESITLAARIHARYFGKTIPSYDGGKWYDGYVSYALQNGIYAEGPYDIPATREVFARILAAALPIEELEDNGSSIDFADENQIRYRSSVELLCQAGVINGVKRGGLTYFDPTDTITRAQAATIITRMVIPDNRTHS